MCVEGPLPALRLASGFSRGLVSPLTQCVCDPGWEILSSLPPVGHQRSPFPLGCPPVAEQGPDTHWDHPSSPPVKLLYCISLRASDLMYGSCCWLARPEPRGRPNSTPAFRLAGVKEPLTIGEAAYTDLIKSGRIKLLCHRGRHCPRRMRCREWQWQPLTNQLNQLRLLISSYLLSVGPSVSMDTGEWLQTAAGDNRHWTQTWISAEAGLVWGKQICLNLFEWRWNPNYLTLKMQLKALIHLKKKACTGWNMKKSLSAFP